MRIRAAAAAVALVVLSTACSGSGNDQVAGPAPTPTPPGTVASVSASRAAPPGAAATVAPGDARAALPDWPMYHGNPAHSGLSTTMPAARGKPRIVASLKLDGAVYASPIVVGGVTLVGTENDSVYAFDSAGRQLWRVHLGSPSPQTERPCGDISPLGITGTPVYSAQTGEVYLVAELTKPVRHQLVAMNPRTGAVRWRRSVDLAGADATVMQQRGALAINGGRVWVSFGALAGDCGNYKGRVVGVRLDGTGSATLFQPSTRRQGGIWNAAGPTVDSTGHMYVVSANGSSFPGDAYDHTNSVLEIGGEGRLLSSFAPTDWAQNNRGDVGLGSQGVALVGTTWAVLGGKSGPVYVLRQGHLGGIGGQVHVATICKSFGGAAVSGSVVYLPCTDGVRAVRIGSDGSPHVLWHAASTIAGSPVVGGGRVWALDQNAGVLHALDPVTGRSLAQVVVGKTSRFVTPALYGSHVLVPTLTGLAIVASS